MITRKITTQPRIPNKYKPEKMKLITASAVKPPGRFSWFIILSFPVSRYGQQLLLSYFFSRQWYARYALEFCVSKNLRHTRTSRAYYYEGMGDCKENIRIAYVVLCVWISACAGMKIRNRFLDFVLVLSCEIKNRGCARNDGDWEAQLRQVEEIFAGGGYGIGEIG